MPQIHKLKLKVCLAGERAVGKTSLIHRYVYGSFEEAYSGTLGTKLHMLSFAQQVSEDHSVDGVVALFDLMGEHAARDAFRDTIFWGAQGVLAVADLSRPRTLYELPAWLDAVRSVAGDVPCVILLNKVDLVPGGAIGPEETRFLLETFPRVPYALTSAKTGEGVAGALENLLRRIVDGVLARSRDRRHANVLAERLLAFAHRRGTAGVAKGEILATFKGTGYETLMSEVTALVRLGYLVLEETGPSSFRVLLTPQGEAAVRKPGVAEFVVEEPT